MQQIYGLLAFATGVFTPLFFLGTPDYTPFCILFVALGALFYWFRRVWLISFLIGLAYGSYSAVSYHQSLLPEPFNNNTFMLTGVIAGIPKKTARSWRFDVHVEQIQPISIPPDARFPESAQSRKIRLSYYGHSDQGFRSGDELVFTARLRRPHGLMNQGLFDYQRWLVSESISATGYITQLEQHRETENPGWIASINRWRQKQSNRFQEAAIARSGVQAALTVGDRRYIDADTWDLFVDVGVVHLMVISGLHVGFVAGMAYFLSRWLLALMTINSGINCHRWANLAAVIAALAYAGLAGFSTPTIRAVIMLSALLLPRFMLLRTSPWWGLSLALALVALFEPMAALQTGFWLSFLAVLLIFLTFGSSKRERFWLGLIRLQLVFLVGFSGVILLVQGQLNPLGFFANLFAVPLTSMLVVPLEIIGLLIGGLSPEVGVLMWKIAGHILDFMIFLLTRISEFTDWRLQRQQLPFWFGIVSVISGITLFYWSKWWQKLVAFLLLLPLVLPLVLPLAKERFFLELRVFDVGQGLAVMVRQPGYSLVYDTGPRFSEEFDSGSDILLPSLRQYGVKQLNDLVISHPDADHLGGYPGLTQGLSAERVWVGRHSPITTGAVACQQGLGWQTGSVKYAFLSPFAADTGEESESDNDRSCVLQIQFANQSILLPGDIGQSVERRLLEHDLLNNQTLVLIPHHGSKSSSSPDFVRAVNPEVAIVSAGYLNRFNHPADEVIQRYLG